jgi:Gpi18-like mannosyltransferase
VSEVESRRDVSAQEATLEGRPFKAADLVILGLGIFLAIALRLSFFDFESSDYHRFLSRWYDFIVTNGGFSAFEDVFSNYSPLYLYFLTLATYLPLPKLYAIKLVSIAFDFLLAFFVLLIVRLKYENKLVWISSFFAALLTPTVVFNSALWGQCDATYTSMLIASIYFAIQRKLNLSLFFFAVALSFKLQAIFLFPLFIILLLKRRVPIYSFLIIPATYIASILPAWLAGSPTIDLLMVYPRQTRLFPGVGQSAPNWQQWGSNSWGQNASNWHRWATEDLAWDGPNLYQWLPNDPGLFEKPGLVLAGLLVCSLCLLCWRSTVLFDRDIIVKLSLTSVLLLPFTLPEMHERYFFAADVVSIIYAFYWPKRFFIPILVVGASLLSYISFLFYNEELISSQYLAILMGVALIFAGMDLIKSLYPNLVEQLRTRQLRSS